MHVYYRKNGMTLYGKVWEIREYLKQQSREYHTVAEWCRASSSRYHWTADAIPKKKSGSLSIVRPIEVKGNGEAF